MAGISHASVLGAGAGVACELYVVRVLFRAVDSADERSCGSCAGSCCSDDGRAAAAAGVESVSGMGQFHLGARPKFSSTSPVN